MLFRSLIWELESRPALPQPEPALHPHPRQRVHDRWWQYENRGRGPSAQQRPRRGSREYDAAMWIYAQARDPRPLSTIFEGSSIASTEDLRSLISRASKASTEDLASLISNATAPSRVKDFLDGVSFSLSLRRTRSLA